MIDEDLLRDVLSTLGTHPPVTEDRVGAVRERVRRRARRRAAVAGAAAVAVLGTLGALVLPGVGDDRVTLPGRAEPAVQQTPDPAQDYRVTITQAVVTLPGVPLVDAVQRVSAALEPTQLGRTVRNASLGQTSGRVRVDFDRELTPRQEAEVSRALRTLPGAEVVLRDVPGFDLLLIAPLSERVRTELEATGAYVPEVGPGPLSDALGGSYGVTPDGARRRMTVEYSGPALSDDALRTARRELARIAGVSLDQVRLERNPMESALP